MSNHIPDLEQTFRWFGPGDPVTLQAIRQTGATGIVTALHDIPCGEIWSREAIRNRKAIIEEAGFRWSVVESVNIHESIKIGQPIRASYIAKYIETLKNLAAEGIDTVCYNFMPVLDWTRTHLDYRLPNDASALLYNAVALAAFDLYILERESAANEFTEAQKAEAKRYFESISGEERDLLAKTILAGLPGTDDVYTIPEFKAHLEKYKSVDRFILKANLTYFLRAIIPDAEKLGIKMCIHPDDPPFPILGLPRIVTNETDLKQVVASCPSPSNGITLCTGSLGANPINDIPGIISRMGKNIHFLHLRNVQRSADGSFYEADHLNGSTDMFLVMKSIIEEQIKRSNSGLNKVAIPMRPDHGHKLLDDFNYNTYPGYSVIGRLKGLAELRGLEQGIKRQMPPLNF